jgi:hypothetical protein
MAAFLGDLIQARTGFSHPACWPGRQVSARARYAAASWRARGLLPCCLCTNMWMTCAQRCRACVYAVEILGIPLAGRNQNRVFTWESASHTLCIQRKLKLSTGRAARNDEEPNVYRRFIWL